MLSEKVLYIISTPIGNIDDITLRGIKILKQCEAIICEDTRVSSQLLSRLDIPKKPLISYNNFNETSKSEYILNLFNTYTHIGLISDAGTPLISDPGYLLIQLCYQYKIKVIPIPGVSSPIVALSASGLPCDKFFFIGFLPKVENQKFNTLNKYAKFESTLIFFESPHRIINTLICLAKIYPYDHNICIAREMTKKFEEFLTKPLKDMITHFENTEPLGEFVVVVPPLIEATNVDSLSDIILQNINLYEPSNLAKNLAKIYGINKKDVYKKILELKK
jgi:16S rRNA (cytidine1402-2'-O)-methyltransferase